MKRVKGYSQNNVPIRIKDGWIQAWAAGFGWVNISRA